MAKIESIALDKLSAHPDNPNRISDTNFKKLMRNIESTGCYEPLIVRVHPQKADHFQIINGHHRKKALTKLGSENAECIVWDVTDDQTDILLMTLNRLGGTDVLSKKLSLLKKLTAERDTKQLSKLLPQTASQINKLISLKLPRGLAKSAEQFLNPLVFFVDDSQKQTIEQALAAAETNAKTKAARRALALTKITNAFLKNDRGLDGQG